MPIWKRDNSAVTAMFRCDPEAQTELGVKIEIKNMNSISGVRRALAYEIRARPSVLKRGGKLRAGNARLG